jgi:branched-chain amino acid transport system permease protein
LALTALLVPKIFSSGGSLTTSLQPTIGISISSSSALSHHNILLGQTMLSFGRAVLLRHRRLPAAIHTINIVARSKFAVTLPVVRSAARRKTQLLGSR